MLKFPAIGTLSNLHRYKMDTENHGNRIPASRNFIQVLLRFPRSCWDPGPRSLLESITTSFK